MIILKFYMQKILLEYFIILFCQIKFYSKIHSFIRNYLLTKTQSIILFQIKEVIKNMIKEWIIIILNEYNNLLKYNNKKLLKKNL
jgi:cytochrome b subunit of formate dehydrogenase